MPGALNTILFKASPATGEIEDFDVLFMSNSGEDLPGIDPPGKPLTLLNDFPARAKFWNSYKQVAYNDETLVLEIIKPGVPEKKIRCSITGNNRHVLESWEYIDSPASNLKTGKNDQKHATVSTKKTPVLPPQKPPGSAGGIAEKKDTDKTIRDLTRELAAKNRELGYLSSEFRAFSAIAANDYKELLKKMYTSIEYIITHDAAVLSNEGRANLRRVQSGIQRMKLLTEDIVSFSSLEALPEGQEWVNLVDYVQQVKNVVSRQLNGSDISIECKVPYRIKGYPTMLYLLFYHLLDNAVKFRSSERTLQIHIECSRVNGLFINHADAAPDTLYDLVRIADNGIGFEQDSSGKIFGMFYRIEQSTKFKGSGIGLAFCRKIMQIHNGFVSADGHPDKGAVFNCYFPCLGD